MKIEPYVTNHAKQRIHERMGVNRRGSERIAGIALEKGLKASETKGRLKKYTDAVCLSHCVGNNLRIYAEKVFIFHDNALITVLSLPNELKKLANICQMAKREAAGIA